VQFTKQMLVNCYCDTSSFDSTRVLFNNCSRVVVHSCRPASPFCCTIFKRRDDLDLHGRPMSRESTPGLALIARSAPMAMKLNQTVHRESLNTAEGTQLPCMPALFEGVAEHKSTRYTWAFNPTQGQIHERAGEDCERLEDESRLKHDSSVSLQQHPVSRTSSLNAEHMATFRNTQTRRSDLKRRHSLQSGNLAPIMEKKHVEISTVMQNRVAVPKVMRWDGRTRTTSVWDSLRRVS
jgi:hypothetical protein